MLVKKFNFVNFLNYTVYEIWDILWGKPFNSLWKAYSYHHPDSIPHLHHTWKVSTPCMHILYSNIFNLVANGSTCNSNLQLQLKNVTLMSTHLNSKLILRSSKVIVVRSHSSRLNANSWDSLAKKYWQRTWQIVTALNTDWKDIMILNMFICIPQTVYHWNTNC